VDPRDLLHALTNDVHGGPEPWVVSVVLVVDQSGSMKPFARAVPEAVDELLQRYLASPDAERTRLAVVTFAERGEVSLPFSRPAPDLHLRDYAPEGGTRLVDTVRDVLLAMLEHRFGDDERVVVAVITDGKDTASTPDSRWEVQALATRAIARDFVLLTFGIGTDAANAARTLGFPDDAASAQTLARRAESLFQSLGVVSSHSIPPGISGVRRT
jgi:Mg-chelatase subunit ChlD